MENETKAHALIRKCLWTPTCLKSSVSTAIHMDTLPMIIASQTAEQR
jgi:hypothetical protein